MFPIHATVPTAAEVRTLFAASRRLSRVDVDAMVAELTGDEPDAALIELASTPFSSVDDVADGLDRIEGHLREREDRRSVFLTVYIRMTEAVRAAIEAEVFADPEWVSSYLVTFAEYYREALLTFERREFESLPRAWLIAFATAVRGDALVAQDALLGINAHINDDLTYTLRDVAVDPDRRTKRVDHDRINEILSRLVTVVRETLVEVYDALGVRGIDALFDPLDDRFVLLGLEGSREFAWRNAVLLADLPSRTVERYVGWRVRTVSTGAAALVLAPKLDPRTRRRLRSAEAEVETLSAFRDALRRRSTSVVVER